MFNMEQINNINRITDYYKEWTPSDLAFIKSFSLEYCNLLITFLGQSRKHTDKWPDNSKRFYETTILFENVSNLKLDITPCESDLYQICGFDIINISDNALENINFQIEDYENNAINFYCKSISVQTELRHL